MLHNEELHNLHTSPTIIRVIKSRSVGWVEHVTCNEMRTEFCSESQNGGDQVGRSGCGWDDNIRIHLREEWKDVD
jgi:hypothetical protein